ncbi:uncharacterized protein [Dysidea avara]|uniref:uncharacterized protein n=1 Tax=Dysidea avara TaxID=196820 RepID=UPI00331D880D
MNFQDHPLAVIVVECGNGAYITWELRSKIQLSIVKCTWTVVTSRTLWIPRLSGHSGLPTSSSWYVTWNLAGAKIRVLRISVNSGVVCSLLYFSLCNSSDIKGVMKIPG